MDHLIVGISLSFSSECTKLFSQQLPHVSFPVSFLVNHWLKFHQLTWHWLLNMILKQKLHIYYLFLKSYTLIYCSGILIETLADASNEGHSLSAPQIVFNVIGFCATVVTTIIFTIFAKRRLKVLQDEPLLA